ncbi:MAG: penicillin acylase family protein [Saprospiraceae bacterium]|nr:penicillin acylase family protein [Saprospiraceae bacterium]
MLRICLSLVAGALSLSLVAQINPDNIQIARDNWGVPHIFAKTDVEVAYGFAWATAEDDFETMQQQLLPIKGLAGLVNGRSGAIFDVGVHILNPHDIVEEKYETDVSPAFKEILEAYAAGVNSYAATHKKEVLHRKLFPITPKDILKTYVVGMALLSGVDNALDKLLSGKVAALPPNESRGSNAFAVSSKRTADGQTYLGINSHQPLEGLNSWYEAHLCSEEGWNILGATFAGGVSIFTGTNEHLGWAHTVNKPDFADIFQLEMHPTNKEWYRFDDKWERLETYDTKARIKLMGFFKVGVKQKFFRSKYGVTVETPNGFFALRFPANQTIQAAEQWYLMNKATNLQEWKKALEMQGIICTNIVYADMEDHIYYVSNGKFPVRNKAYDWAGVVPGNTSATLWDSYYPLDSLAQVLDPPSGFVYNCNHTPFLSTSPSDNPKASSVPATMGYEPPQYETNRAVRMLHLFEEDKSIDYEEFKVIKFDRTYHKPMRSAPKLEPIFSLDETKYPQIAGSIQLLKEWDRVASDDSEAASIFILALYDILRKLEDRKSLITGDELDEASLAASVQSAQNHLQENFGKVRVPLGQVQRHSRGEVSLAYGGGPDVLAAVGSRLQKDGRLRPIAGDSYIQLVRFTPDGPVLETINAYGASAKPDSPHFTDQMELFTQQKLKPMTLNKEQVLKNAKRVYAPK